MLTTQRNLAAATLNVPAWRFDAASVSLTPLPMFHIGGIGWTFLGLSQGATTILVSEFDAVAVLDLLESARVTNAVFVPTILQMLTAVPGAAERDYSALRSIAYGASPITTPVLKAALRTFGCPLFGVYGLTETTGGVVQLDPDDHDPDGPREHLLRSAGRPRPWMELRVVDPRQRRASSPPGAVGEVWMRGPNVMAGYANRPEETAKALTPDGWLRTGDGGYLDEDGYLFLTDRIKDMIVTGGENVYPVEVEEALSQHPAVAEVAVIGVPDERWGEAVKASWCTRPARRDVGERARRLRPRAARRLQAAAVGRLRRRPPAHAVRQGAQARAARPLPQRRQPPDRLAARSDHRHLAKDRRKRDPSLPSNTPQQSGSARDALVLVLLGPPGAGKGTQGRLLADSEGLLLLSTGAILRAACEAGTRWVNRHRAIMRAGELVPDQLIDDVMAERLARPDPRAGFILDGYPRPWTGHALTECSVASRGPDARRPCSTRPMTEWSGACQAGAAVRSAAVSTTSSWVRPRGRPLRP